MQFEHAQLALMCGHQIEIRFIPAAGIEKYCFAYESLRHGLSLVAKLEALPKSRDPGMARIVLTYDPGERAYAIARIEYKDGTVEHPL
jgi:hypothetical protein